MRNGNAGLSETAHGLKELWFSCGQDIMRPVKTMIADSYPAEKRERLSSHFDPKVLEEYDKTFRRANSLLYEQRNKVQSVWLVRYDLAISKNSGGEDWDELKGCLVDNCLDRLCEQLVANSPLLVNKEYIERLQAAVEKATEMAKERMTEHLKRYSVKRKPGYGKLSEVYGG
jgi:hypothetical protein